MEPRLSSQKELQKHLLAAFPLNVLLKPQIANNSCIEKKTKLKTCLHIPLLKLRETCQKGSDGIKELKSQVGKVHQ